MDIKTIEGSEISFNFTIDEYIEEYNKNYGSDYLYPSDDSLAYHFTEDEKIFTLPVIDIAATEENEYVKQITFSFDWHSFSPELLDKFEKMCFYGIKTVHLSLSDEEINDIVDDAIDMGYDNPVEKDSDYPYAVFVKDDVGICTCFSIGGSHNIYIIPMTDDRMDEFEENDVIIREY